MSINKGATPSSTVLNVAGGSSLTFGGGLVVSNPSGALALDDTFTLFTAPGYTGTFSSLTLPALPLGLAWDTSKLAVNGSITVVIPPTLTWDVNTTITGAQDGTGTWNLTAINWWNGAGDVAWSDGSYASFGVDTPANRTVTLASDMAPAGILFNATGGGTYTLASGGGNIVLSGAPRVTNVANATISAVLKGSGSVSKAGAGTLTLTGNNTYSGDTTIDGGTLVLNASSSTYVYSGGPISINNASTLRLAGSRYDFSGKTFTFDSNGGGTIDTSSGLNFVSWSPGNTFATAGGAQNLIIGTSGMNINSGVVNTFNVMRGTGVSDLKVTTHIWNTGGILKTGNGILELTGANTYTGATTVTNGTLLMNGSQASGSAINVTNATLAGTGSVGGTVTIRNGATIAPGVNGVGTLATGAEIWYGGGSYLCEINGTNANSSDRLNISGQLNVQATPGNPFIIKLVSLSGANAPGPIPNFDKFTSYSWTNAIATSSANLAESRFVLDTSSISNGFGGGTFSLAVSGNSLVVKYTRALLPPVWGGYGPLNGHSFPLVFSGPSGQTYKVLSTTNVSLPMASWATLATGTFGVSPVTYTDATATNDARFYRIVSP
jgi:autotransporter-associated beta strand protein